MQVIYAPIDKLYAWDRKFDVLLAGAIIEHFSDPVSAIGVFARLAEEAVIFPFTEVVDTDEESMHPAAGRVFDNLGFDVDFIKSTAVYIPAGSGEVTRPTIIACRRPAGFRGT